METDGIALIIIAVFALAGLVLMFARAFMQDIARTIETWRELQETWRGDHKKGAEEDPRDD